MKTSELTGAALDWAVASIEWPSQIPDFALMYLDGAFDYSTDWSQGGPIIERERIRIDCPWGDGPFEASCKIDGMTAWTQGPTVLIAAMRGYVVSKLGIEVEIPKGLT